MAHPLRKPQNYSTLSIYFKYVQTFPETCNLYKTKCLLLQTSAKVLAVLILSFKSPTMLYIMEYKTQQSY